MQYDVIIVGGGMGGLIALRQALQCRLKVLLLEQSDQLGGLWSQLPFWQDIQSRTSDWALYGTPISGVHQPEILQNILSWVGRFDLAPYIQLNEKVTGARLEAGLWKVQTSASQYNCKNLVVASGPFQKKAIPQVPRTESQDEDSLEELHSSEISDPSILRGKSVTVVGASASALDVLSLALENGAREVHWLYRRPYWFVPTNRPKYLEANVRFLALAQMLGIPKFLIEFRLNRDLGRRYRRFGLESIQPKERFDLDQDVLIPGRQTMIAQFQQIRRHQGEIEHLQGRRLVFDGGEFETDMLVYATGYRMDLSFLNIESISRPRDLLARTSLGVKSLDFPGLYFLGLPLAETNSVTSFYYNVTAQILMREVSGEIQLPNQPTPVSQIQHWNLLKLLSRYDRQKYPVFFWRLKFLAYALYYFIFRNRQVKLF